MKYLSEIFCRHSWDFYAMFANSKIFIVCLSVCLLAYFLTEIRQIQAQLSSVKAQRDSEQFLGVLVLDYYLLVFLGVLVFDLVTGLQYTCISSTEADKQAQLSSVKAQKGSYYYSSLQID